MSIRSLRTSGHWPDLTAALIHFDVSFMIWVLIGALGAYISSSLGLSPGQKGLMVAVPPLGGAMFRMLLGPGVDRFGARRTGLFSMAFTVVPLRTNTRAAGFTVFALVCCISAAAVTRRQRVWRRQWSLEAAI